MKTSEIIIQVANDIEAALNKQTVPGPNTGIISQLQGLAASLNGKDVYAAEKAYQIAELAGIYYSVRKHVNYPGGSSALWAKMAYDLVSTLKSQANVRNFHGD
ncbi:MAG: hypothetical protein ACOYMG_22835 [Candidatus Methylumidiphilus sp.]